MGGDGRPRPLRVPARLRDFLDARRVETGGGQWRVFHRRRRLVVVGGETRAGAGAACSRTVSVDVLDPATFQVLATLRDHVDSAVTDVAVVDSSTCFFRVFLSKLKSSSQN